MEERFWAKVDKSLGLGPQGECWQWTANRKLAYGYFRTANATDEGGDKMSFAHRISHELLIGPIPAKMLVLHRCDNPLCVNPAHLFLGTQLDNMRDMAAKGRGNQQKKTHCPQGHEYAIYASSSGLLRGVRSCKLCATKSGRQQVKLLKEAKNHEQAIPTSHC